LLTIKRPLLQFLLLSVVPYAVGLTAVELSSLYTVTTVTPPGVCNSVFQDSQSGYPEPFIGSFDMLHYTNPCTALFVFHESLDDWRAFGLDLIFYVEVYYAIALGVLALSRLTGERETPRLHYAPSWTAIGATSKSSVFSRHLTELLLIVSTSGFVSKMTVYLSQSPIFLFDATSIAASQIQILASSLVFLIPLSLSLVLTVKGKTGGVVVIWIGLLLVTSFAYAMPLITVQRYSAQCNGTYAEWQSLGYRLFGVGLRTEGVFCES